MEGAGERCKVLQTLFLSLNYRQEQHSNISKNPLDTTGSYSNVDEILSPSYCAKHMSYTLEKLFLSLDTCKSTEVQYLLKS